MVKAGAGAGKTYGLIHKIVDLVKEHTRKNSKALPRFVVTTFTRKATQEVRERLLSKALELRREDPEFGDLFLNFLKSSGYLMVSTIHGVLNLFLRQHGSVIGLDPDFKVAPLSQTLLTEVLHNLLLENPNTINLVNRYGWRNVKIILLEYHRSTILNPDIEVLPESHFIQYWEKNFNNLKNLTSDLTNYIEPLLAQAKGESLPRFQESLRAIHRVLNEEIDLWKRLSLLKEIYKKSPRNLGPLKQWDDSYKEMRTQVMGILSDLDEDLLTVKENFVIHHQDKIYFQELGARFSELWFKKKIELGELEMEDLELLSLYILRHFSDQSKSFSDSWNYWFIDEYQDTSPIQVELLNYLIGPCPHYVVGDPQQSIYFFRGARSKVFHEKLNLFKRTSAKIEEKKVNRRSQSPTLYFINDLMDLVNKHQFSPMESLSEKDSPELLVGHFYLISESHEELHLEHLVKTLFKLIQEGVDPSNIAILCRENSELQRVFTKIKSVGLPAQVYSKGRFLEDRQVKDALCLWNFLINPFNDINLIELLRSPWFFVPDQILLEVGFEKKSHLWNQIKTLSNKTIQKLNQSLNQLSKESHFLVWQSLLLDTQAFHQCTELDSSGRKEANLWKLITLIHEGIKTGKLDYTDPLKLDLQIETNNENEAQSIRDSHQIQLMTIHGSKGLEFDHVILPFLNHSRKKESASFFTTDLETQFWSHSYMNEATRTTQNHYFARTVMEEINSLLDEETERLFYVAITRSKKSLHFFCPKNIEEVSKTGWSRHLQSFLSKEPGQYTANSGKYKFEIIILDEEQVSSSESPLYQCETNSGEVKKRIEEKTYFKRDKLEHDQNELGNYTRISTTDLLKMHLSGSTSKILNSLKSETESPLNDLASIRNLTEWDGVPIKKGIRIHREFECYSISNNNHLLSNNSIKFLESVSFPLSELLLRGQPEWPFSVKIADLLVEGQIDLWGRDEKNQLWIVDYKTGSAKYYEKAFLQMHFYALALLKTQQIKLNESVFLVVCYPTLEKSFIREILFKDILLFEENLFSQ